MRKSPRLKFIAIVDIALSAKRVGIRFVDTKPGKRGSYKRAS
jgi:hypothetical protein